jgi:hypothetical protein
MKHYSGETEPHHSFEVFMESDSISNSSSAASKANQEKGAEAQEEHGKGPQKIYIASQSGADVYYFDDEEDIVLKVGSRVREHEAVAMRLVAKHTNIPILQISEDDSAFFWVIGFLGMSRIPGAQPDRLRSLPVTWKTAHSVSSGFALSAT